MAQQLKNLLKMELPPDETRKFVLGVAGVVGLGAAGYNSFFRVHGGERAVVFNRITGVKQVVLREGMHFKYPWFDVPQIFSIRAKAYELSSLTGSKDLQMVNVQLRVLHKPTEQQLPVLYERLGTNYDERVLPSICQEVLRSVVAQFTASQLITQREAVSKMILARLTNRARQFNISLEDVSIIHLAFGREYASAVEAKQVAQQEAERARFIVERAKQSKIEIIVKAEAEAIAAKQLSGQLAQDKKGNFLQHRRIQAAKDIAGVLARSPNKVYLTADSLMINLLSESTHKGDLIDDLTR